MRCWADINLRQRVVIGAIGIGQMFRTGGEIAARSRPHEIRQHLDEEIDGAADHREKKNDEQPVLIAPGSNDVISAGDLNEKGKGDGDRHIEQASYGW